MSSTTYASTDHSGNPAFGDRVTSEYMTGPIAQEATMTRGGVAIKTLINLAVLVAAGAGGWASATDSVAGDMGSGYANVTITIPGGFWLASFGAFFVGIMCSLNPRRAAFLGILYAALQGYVLGAISAMFDAQTEGIVGAAVLSTVCVFFVAWLVYALGIIKPTRKLAFGVSAAMGGLCLLYFIVFIVSLFDWDWLYSESFRTIGLIVTILAIILAALSLTLDFGSIDAGVAAGAPKFMEWYSAYGLMVTLIWLYLLILRLLAVLSRNR
ncbi:MAG: Bax inhibitor-1/YccA family protein [Acidimicrobiales bacterium]